MVQDEPLADLLGHLYTNGLVTGASLCQCCGQPMHIINFQIVDKLEALIPVPRAVLDASRVPLAVAERYF